MEISSYSVMGLLFMLSSLVTSNLIPNLTTDQSSLLSLKSQITSDPSNILTNNWTSKTSVCSWIGVSCGSRHNRVTALSISNMGLKGIIPPEIGNLSFLVSLNMSRNFFNGTLPMDLSRLRRLRVIDFSQNNFIGELPKSWFGSLHQLQYLDIGSNSLQGMIPQEIGNFSKLVDLFLYENQLTGPVPPTIFNISTLEKVQLEINRLTGRLPDNICSNYNWCRLKFLYLGENMLHGQIPSSWCKCSQLQGLGLSYNDLSGPIPSDIGNMTALEMVDLSGNNLTGVIPKQIGHLPNLKSLLIGENKITGSLPDYVCGHQSDGLVWLSLESNMLSGQIPSSWFQNCSKLWALYLSDNNIQGSIPTEIWNMTSLRILDLSGNNLTGVIPKQIGQLQNLKMLSIDSNKLVGSLPDNACGHESDGLELLSLDSNMFSGQIPSSWFQHCSKLRFLFLSFNNLQGSITTEIWNMTALEILDLARNNLTGVIPEQIGQLQNLNTLIIASNKLVGSIPISLCNVTYMEVLDLSGNNLNGTIPPCLLGNNLNFKVLNLGRNKISGHIPDAFSVNCSLQTLDLSGNNLDGKIPSLANCKSLQVVNVGNNNMDDSFPCILKTLPILRVLVLRSNRFHGKIKCPGVNQSWPNLQIIDVASNFFSGYLNPRFFSSWRLTSPEELGHNQLGEVLGPNSEYYYQDKVTVTMKGLEMELVKILSVFTTFDFSCNNFHGKIPNTIGDFRSLHGLNLSHNAFTGTIPASIGNMTQLESLDLTMNHLTGKIPKELASLTFLSVLNLSFNKLSGMIPTGRQLQTFTDASYEGNVELCGFPLNIRCNDLGASPPKLETRQLYRKADINWDYVCAALGYVVGLGTTVCLLLYGNNWRQRYFEKVDQVFSKILNHQDGRKLRGGRKRVGRNEVRRQ